MSKKSKDRKTKRRVQRGGVEEPSSTSSTEPSWTEKFTSFFKKITGPDVKRQEDSTPEDNSTTGQKIDKFTSDAKEKVSDITESVSTTVSDLFGTPEPAKNDDIYQQPTAPNQTGGKMRRRKPATRSTIKTNISKKITKIVNMVKTRMSCNKRTKKSKRNYLGGSSVSTQPYYGSYPNSVGKINVPVPPK